MASPQSLKLLFAIFAAALLSVQAKLECEELAVDLCAFSVSSTGMRCALEKTALNNGGIVYECQSSTVAADQFSEWVETDDCLRACGLTRMSIGLSSDVFAEKAFTKTLCSVSCQENCPNVIDLFTNLATGEGVLLPQFCEAQRSQSRRIMADISILASQYKNTRSLWEAASSPVGSVVAFTAAEAPWKNIPF